MQTRCNIGSQILSVFFPEKCYICGVKAVMLCEDCKKKFVIPVTRCIECGRALPDADADYICQHCFTEKPVYDGGIAFFKYTDAVKSWIHNIKYGKMSYQIRILDIYKDQISKAIYEFNPDLLVPIPLTMEHAYIRGFNQSLIVAQRIAKWTELPVCHALKKTKFTESQTAVDAGRRKRNVKGSFSASKRIQNKKILLIDDVFTTGSTIGEAAKTLKQYTDTVYFFTVAGT